jgi:cysteine desulfuration protein SufE
MTSADIQPPLADQARAIREEFELLGDWEERFAWLIDMGRKLPPMPPHELVDANKVQGCASQVWLVVEPSSRRPGAVVIRGASDALIVSGLVALVVRLLSGQPADDDLRPGR